MSTPPRAIRSKISSGQEQTAAETLDKSNDDNLPRYTSSKVEPQDTIPRRSATIKIVQQPLHARMCGFGEKDRRPVDPPPIVQLVLNDDDSSPDSDYNLFKLPQKRKVTSSSTSARRKDANQSSTATTEGGSSSRSKNNTRQTSSNHSSGIDENMKSGDEETDNEAASEGEDLPHDSNHSDSAGSDDDSSTKRTSRRTAHRRGRKPDKNGVTSPSPSSSTADANIPSWDDFYDDKDTGAIPLLQDPLFVLHCSLWSEDGTEVRNMVATPIGGPSSSSHGSSAHHKRDKGSSGDVTSSSSSLVPPKLTRILMGSVVVSPVLLYNEHGVQGWYFSFPDLSIRTEGVYSLKFTLMRLGSFDFNTPADEYNDQSPVIAEATSQPFTVFSAKKFPGMTESTPLSKAFARQGLKIPIRNDLRVRKNADKDNYQ
ncbi:hypothetical protein BGZ94_009507 [Podila epigama]|nr:hypothetical protein BGZ94_009507 [Podila epigama]